jgi:hypothetical protein
MKFLLTIAAAAAAYFLAAPSWQAPANCLTDGTHQCGPEYLPLDADTRAVFAATNTTHGAHDWSACLATQTTPITIVCADGYATTATTAP